jgi:hypothetical protein
LKAVAVDSLVTVSSGVELACELANDRKVICAPSATEGKLLHAVEPPSISPRRPTAADGESDDSVRSAQHPRKATPPSSPSLGEYSHENSGVVLVLLDLAASRRAIQPAQPIRRRAAVSSLSLLRR